MTVSGEDTILERAFRIFTPFSGPLWGCVILTIVCCSVAIAYHEYPYRNCDDESDFKGLNGVTSLAKSIWLGFWAFGAQSPAHRTHTLGGKIVDLGFGLFLVLTLAAFTANLVAVLTREDDTGISSIDDIITQNLKLCVQATQVPVLLSIYPSVEPLLVEFASRTDVLNGIDKDLCVAGLDSTEELAAVKEAGLHCDKRSVGEPIMTNPYAFPISSHAGLALGYWVSDLKSSGKWDARLSQYSPTNKCADVASSEESNSLEPIHLVGAFLTTGMMIFLSLVASAIQKYTNNHTDNTEIKPLKISGLAENEIEDVDKAIDLLVGKLNALRSEGKVSKFICNEHQE